MDGKQVTSVLDKILKWVTRLAMLNLLWILFSLFGFILGGVFPSTVAALGVSRKWIAGEEDIKIWKTFKHIFRKEFVASNIMGWILTIIGFVLYLNYRVIGSSTGDILFIIPFAFYFVLFFYVIAVIWSFPLLVHYEGRWYQHFKNAVILGLTNILNTMAIGLTIVSVIYLSLEFPGMIPFYSASIIAFGCMWFTMQTFEIIDKKTSQS